MNRNLLNIIICAFLILMSCTKSNKLREFKIDRNNNHAILKLFSDSTYIEEIQENKKVIKYSGIWDGSLNEDSIFTTNATMSGFNVLTTTPIDTYKIKNGQAILVPSAQYNISNQDIDTLTTKNIKQKPIIELIEFKNGRWINTIDSLAGIEIRNGKWIMFYKGMETDSSDIYDINIRREYLKELGTEHKPLEYLTITNESDTLDYSILEYSNELLSLVYINRGNTLNYKPEK